MTLTRYLHSLQFRLKLENRPSVTIRRMLNEHEKFVIHLTDPPVFNSVGGDAVLVEGEGDPSVTLECTANGEPTPNITWTRVYDNGRDSGVLAVGIQFVVENNRTNRGTYRCTAYNGIGTAPNRTAKVEINCK